MPEQLARIAVLQNLETVLEQFGLDAGVELAKLDMDIGMFRDGDLLVHMHTVAAVLEHCASVTHSPDFSLRLAAVQDVSLLGVLALFIQTSDSFGEALQEISLYNHIHLAQGVTWRLEDMGSAVMFNFQLDAEGLSPFQQQLAIDLSLGQAYRVIDALTEGRVRPQRVMLRGDSSLDSRSYRRFFRAAVEFSAEVDGLLLPAGCLQLPLAHPDSKMHEALRQQISAIEKGGEDSSLTQEVRRIIRALLPTGNFSLGRVAKCYACDRRTLQRYLRDEADTTYQALLDDVRFELVQKYLRDSHMPVTQIGYAVGFSDPSNFARAFRKRFGLSPKDWRAQNQDPHRHRVGGSKRPRLFS